MIIIHLDFSNGYELSYFEAISYLNKGIPFHTHCLDFFTAGYKDKEVIVIKDRTKWLSLKDVINYSDYPISKIKEGLINNKFPWNEGNPPTIKRTIETITGYTEDEIEELELPVKEWLNSKGIKL